MPLAQRPPTFNPFVDDFQRFIEQFEEFFILNGITDNNVKKGYLLTSINDHVYKTVQIVCHPKLAKELEYEELCRLLTGQFVSLSSIYGNRIEFYNSEQEDSESIINWFERIRTLSFGCQFGADLEWILLDRFVSGLKESVVLDKLLEERDLSDLIEVLNLAIKTESNN